MQATEARLPCVAWGSGKRTAVNEGMYHFYTDDERFSRLYSDCSPLLNSGVKVVIEPNFSVFGQMPMAVAVFQVFKKRWLARTWQKFGVRVFVDMNVHPRYALLNTFGVPVGWRSYATRGGKDHLEQTINEYEIALNHSRTDKIAFVVVGGGEVVADAARDHGWLYINETMDVIGSKGKERRSTNVSTN